MLSLLQNIFLFWLGAGKLDCGASRNEHLLFKNNVLHHIAKSRRFLELIIIAKYRAPMGKTTVLKVSIYIDTRDKLNRYPL